MRKKLSFRLSHQLLIIMVLLLVFSSIIYAAPLKDVPTTVTQPNGDILRCLASGDEFFNYLHDINGNIIIQHQETGYYTYARLDEAGKIIASQQIALDNGCYYNFDAVVYSPAFSQTEGLKLVDIDFSLNPDLIHEFPDTENYLPRELLVEAAAGIGMTGNTVKGTMENVIVMICFADEDPTIDPVIRDKIETVFNGSTLSLNHYMRAVSENFLELHSTLVGLDGDTVLMYQDSHPRKYYQPYNAATNPLGYQGGDNGSERSVREKTLLANAVKAIDNSSILSGKNLDIDGDDRVDSITFIINGNVDGWSQLLWPHKWNLTANAVHLNGKQVYNYSFQLLNRLFPASGNSNLGVICHESLHTFGLPDLYRYAFNGNPVMYWDIMAANPDNPQFPNSHSRLRYVGWGKPLVEIKQNGRYVLSPIGSTDGITAYAIPTSNTNSNQFILLEYRSNANPSGYDTYFGTGTNFHKGLTIARINLGYKGNENGSGGTNDEVYIYRPSETALNQGGGNCSAASLSADASRTFFGNTILSSGFDSTIYLYNGTNTKYIISNVSIAGQTIAFDVKIRDDISDGHLISYVAGDKGTLSALKNGLPLNSGDRVISGDSVRFNAAADPDYIADQWFVNGQRLDAAQGLATYDLNNINAPATVICTFKRHNAQTPQITVWPLWTIYDQNETADPLTATVEINDGGTLSYQWYSNSVSSTIGAIKINGATAATYTPSTTMPGVSYYYVVVTNTNNSLTGNKTAIATAEIATVTVKAPFAAVTDIIGVQAAAKVGIPLTLKGTVVPVYANKQDIIWSVKDAGATGAVIEGNVLNLKSAGTAVVTATVRGGQTEDSISAMALGEYHTVTLKDDGSLWAWGNNSRGQLGDGTTINRNSPVQAGMTKDWATVATGSSHTIASKMDGSLWAWGYNNQSQLGDGTATSSSKPVQVGTDKDWAAAAAGSFYTIALKSDGSLWAWGQNSSGQLGDGTTTIRRTPVQVGTASDWISITAGSTHTIALKNDGSLWAWGNNTRSQLGDGTITNRNTPKQVGTDKDWVSIAAGEYHTIALKSDGSLWAWGHNNYGQLGDGTNTGRNAPFQIGEALDWAAIAVNGNHNIALKNDGSLWTWGYNQYGQLGDGTIINRNTPTWVGETLDWAVITAGIFHTAALKNDGSLWAWGNNTHGQLGDSSTTRSTIPVQITAKTAYIKDFAIEVADYGLGVRVSGKIKSYNPNNLATIRLMQGDKEIDKTSTPDATGYGQVEQEFKFENVVPGKYDLVIEKDAHTKFTVHNVVVGEEDLDLTLLSRPEVQLMTLRCGDISNDGLINDADLTILWRAGNYNKKTDEADNPWCDLNGDGLINDADLTILWMAYNYNRGPVDFKNINFDNFLGFEVN